MKYTRALTATMLAIIIIFSSIPIAYGCSADYALYTIKEIANWKKSQASLNSSDYLLNGSNLSAAGNGIDWYVIALSRVGIKDNYSGYLKSISEYITEKYKTEEKLSSKKATEWHRITLAVLSADGDPTQIGTTSNGSLVNLIADGVYNRQKLTAQGINGAIWGLIALNSLKYTVPTNAVNNYDSIITEILSNQLQDGGFSLIGTVSDVDITSDAVTALAPYYGSNLTYTYTNKKTKTEETKSVTQVINEAINLLSEKQNSNGGFSSWNTENSESISKVITALCAVKINPNTDSRFIKNDNLIDALLSYQNSDGGISHIKGEQSNSMAGEQAICALSAYYRLKNNMNSLYDFSAEPITNVDTVITEEEKQEHKDEETQINSQIENANNSENNAVENSSNSGDNTNVQQNTDTQGQDVEETTAKTETPTAQANALEKNIENKNSAGATQAATQNNNVPQTENNIVMLCLAIGIIFTFGSVAWGVKKNKSGRENDFNPLSVDRETENKLNENPDENKDENQDENLDENINEDINEKSE